MTRANDHTGKTGTNEPHPIDGQAYYGGVLNPGHHSRHMGWATTTSNSTDQLSWPVALFLGTVLPLLIAGAGFLLTR